MMRVPMNDTQIGSDRASAAKLFEDGLFTEGGFE
jgi:hypothetical protein